jgi:hypothetical protein
MKTAAFKVTLPGGFALLLASVLGWPEPLSAQPVWPYAPPPPMVVPQTPNAQRNALGNLRSRVDWLRNATRTAPSYATGGFDMVWQQFQWLRASYDTFKQTLNPRQMADGANEVAELDAGLDILQEAFSGYQEDVAAGRTPSAALRDMCQVLSQAAAVWLQQLTKDSARLRVGW